MPLSRIIPAALHDAVLAKLGELNPDTRRPYTNREVAAWLGDTHGVQCSHMAVQRLAAAVQKDAEEFAAKALRQEFINSIEPMRVKVMALAKTVSDAVKTEDDTSKAAAGLRAVTGALEAVAKIAGITATRVDVTSGGKTIATATVVVLPALEPDDDDDTPEAPGALGAEPRGTNGLPRE